MLIQNSLKVSKSLQSALVASHGCGNNSRKNWRVTEIGSAPSTLCSHSRGLVPQIQRSGPAAGVAVRKCEASIYPAPALQIERGLQCWMLLGDIHVLKNFYFTFSGSFFFHFKLYLLPEDLQLQLDSAQLSYIHNDCLRLGCKEVYAVTCHNSN